MTPRPRAVAWIPAARAGDAWAGSGQPHAPGGPPAGGWRPADREELAGLAVEWLNETRTRDDGPPVLVTDASGRGDSVSAIADFGRRYGRVTSRSPFGAVRGPVLAYVPSAADLELAQRLAWDRPLCVVATPDHPLTAWAGEIGAVNLLDRSAVRHAFAVPVARALEGIKLLGGNNGWAGTYELEHARRRLAELPVVALDADAFCGWMLARGVGARGVRRLRRLVEEVRSGGTP